MPLLICFGLRKQIMGSQTFFKYRTKSTGFGEPASSACHPGIGTNTVLSEEKLTPTRSPAGFRKVLWQVSGGDRVSFAPKQQNGK